MTASCPCCSSFSSGFRDGWRPSVSDSALRVSLLDFQGWPKLRIVGIGMGHNGVKGIVAAVALDDDEHTAVPIGGGGTCRARHEKRHRRTQGQQRGRLQKRSTSQHDRFLSVQASCARGDDSRIVTALASPGFGSVPKSRRWWNMTTESASGAKPIFPRQGVVGL